MRNFAIILGWFFVASLGLTRATSAQDWQDHVARHNELRREAGLEPLPVEARPSRHGEFCTVCHLGPTDFAQGSGTVAASGFHAPHPYIPHHPTDLPCASCHGGDGSSLDADVAHGADGPWGPFLPRRAFESGCGTCHSATSIAEPDLALRGRDLYAAYGCDDCHDDPTRSRAEGGALAAIGLLGVDEGWAELHETERTLGVNRGFADYRTVPRESDRRAITRYLETRFGAPTLERGKLLFHRAGCRSCHSIYGLGGDVGPPLDRLGLRTVDEFPGGGDRSPYEWLASFLRDPSGTFPDTTMPNLHRTADEVDALVVYLLSLRRSDGELARRAPDRLATEVLTGREFHPSGRNVYQVFCSICHGSEGKGSWFDPTAVAASAIAHVDFLGVVSDDFLVASIERGRAGRNMPAWVAEATGLSAREIRDVVRYLRTFEPTPPSFEAVEQASIDPFRGAQIYASECRSCHGVRSEGGLAPSHLSPAFRALVTDQLLYDTLVQGRPGTGMPSYRDLDAGELASVIGYVRALADASAPDLDLITLEVPLGNAEVGERDYVEYCGSCHGPEGSGGRGPAIGNWAFQRAAGKIFVMESYRRKRCRDAAGSELPFVDPTPLSNVAAYLENVARRPGASLVGARITGDAERGSELYGERCAGCHGDAGQSGPAPAIGHPDFLEIATDGQIQATIIRGHRGTPMPRQPDGPFGFTEFTADDVNSIVAYLRALQPRSDEPTTPRR
ncbi:MAG: c-type cytochrome [Planctomycetes bacterium]|nr:c-type cytochrome [Planctomycetota bacterium]